MSDEKTLFTRVQSAESQLDTARKDVQELRAAIAATNRELAAAQSQIREMRSTLVDLIKACEEAWNEGSQKRIVTLN